MADETGRRKDAHLDLVLTEEVEPEGSTTLLEDVHLVHNALPELALVDLDTRVPFMGKELALPLLITGMTGGTERAQKINLALAAAAEKHRVAFGVGSQRAMSERPETARTFRVREVAPKALVLGNLGLWQAIALGSSGVQKLRDEIGADGMAVHLNAGQELVQPEGDRDFRGGYQAIGQLAKVFGDRLLIKETGCGISPLVARRLVELGVRHVDVSGTGGTSWIRVEALRAEGEERELGRELSNWGIPTAAAIASVAGAVGKRATVIGSGGIRTGSDAAKAIALGANLVGMALPMLRAQQAPEKSTDQALERFSRGLKAAMLLTGSRNLAELAAQPKVISGPLKDWIAALGGSIHG